MTTAVTLACNAKQHLKKSKYTTQSIEVTGSARLACQGDASVLTVVYYLIFFAKTYAEPQLFTQNVHLLLQMYSVSVHPSMPLKAKTPPFNGYSKERVSLVRLSITHVF